MMDKREYEIGLLLNEMSKRTVNYDQEQILNYLCAIFCRQLLNTNYELLPEWKDKLLLIIEEMKR